MNADQIADAALPCPFCGERLIVHTDHHGQWVAHRHEPGPCIDSVTQLHDTNDLRLWNTRNGVQSSVRDFANWYGWYEREGFDDESREELERIVGAAKKLLSSEAKR